MARGRKTGGRLKGTPNKTTGVVKQALSDAFDKLGGVPALVKWGKANDTEFYKLWSRLLPTEVTGADGDPLIPDLPPDERQARVLSILQAAKARKQG